MRRTSPGQSIDMQPQLLALLIVAIVILGRSVPPVNLLVRFFSSRFCHIPADGDDGDRTRNLRLAKPALSQLSYIPSCAAQEPCAVGVLGFEPRTSALSELRSSQLSYTPSVPATNKKAKPILVWLDPAT